MPLMTHSSPVESRLFHQVSWNTVLADHVAEAAADWFVEDLGHECDWTSVGLIPAGDFSELDVVVRDEGMIAGLEAAAVVARVADSGLTWQPVMSDGSRVTPGTVVARLSGPTRSVLAAERVILNLLGRMSGVARATRQLVDAVRGTSCHIYDTRKTVPGWRLLDKYAVRLGGGWNHRLGLYDAILIKDNHLAALAKDEIGPGEAVRRARAFVAKAFPPSRAAAMMVEIELDGLEQFEAVLAAGPDVILLDNMPPEVLAEAVANRDRAGSATVLEASGGIRLDTVAAIARSGVDRISTGWPTHHAPWLDVALDW
jgi:nicotinate-nucleotide pyrophosphorylase (carboxylating)